MRAFQFCLAAAGFVMTVLFAIDCRTLSQPTAHAAEPASEARPPEPRPADKKVEATPDSIAAAHKRAAAGADAARHDVRTKTFEEFEREVYKERGEDGKYIVNGDTPIAGRKLLREFFELDILPETPRPRELTLWAINGRAMVWNREQRKNLTYCVSTDFNEDRRQQVIDDMKSSAAAWSAVADVRFVHVAAEDADCDAQNPNVVFDVSPVDVGGYYYARAFFPNEPRTARNVLIDDSSFRFPANGNLQLDGILRHELGHTVGLRHEQTRPEAGKCFEDDNWIPVTSYDRFSVMHYPQCNGGGDWSLSLTESDKSGLACVYGAAPGFQPDPDICDPMPTVAPATPQPTTRTWSDQSVSAGQEKSYGFVKALPGTRVDVVMTRRGQIPGDPDLYVRFFGAPNRTERRFDCRPFLDGANESCALDVPAGQTQTHLMVHGYTAGEFDLAVTYTPVP